MSSFPATIDGPSTLFSPVDAFSTKSLETTASGPINAGDSTIGVASTAGGFADAYGVLSINDELIVYTGKTATQFTGCQRGAFGTVAASHASGVAVKANMVAGFITALQSAIVAVENEIGTASARSYVRKDGAVTVTGLKTFQDGAEFGSGTNAAGTGLMRLPNAGAIKWRKADNSGDLGMGLNTSNHLVMDAVIDFAVGQTFGALSYPDASTTAKGIVQIDPTGGIAVAAGVISLAVSGVTAGTYAKVTVDAKGRVTAGSTLAADDLPAHLHVMSDVTSLAAALTAKVAGASNLATVGKLPKISSAGTVVESAIYESAGAVGIGTTSPGNSLHVVTSTNLGGVTASGAVDNVGFTITSTGTGGRSWCIFSTAGNSGAGRGKLSIWDNIAFAHRVVIDSSGNVGIGTVVPGAVLDVAGSVAVSGPVANGPYQTIGGAFENMAKYSEDFSVATWDKNAGSCTVTANSIAAPDGNTTADAVTAATTTPIIQQQIAGLVSAGQYTFYVWAKVASGTKQVSIAIVDNAYATYLAGPTSISLTTSWQRFKITGTLAGGQTGLWIVVRQYAGNGDNWTSGAIYLWGACLQQGNDPKRAYARTWGYQTAAMAAGVACGAVAIAAKDNSESPLRVYGPGSNLADHRLLEVTSGGELILAGGTGNGYRLAELMGATNPSGWSGVLKVKTPAGATAGYILLYSNP